MRRFADERDVDDVLQLVRCFGDGDLGEEEHHEVVIADGMELDMMPGQHRLLGWHLDRATLEFLVSIRAAPGIQCGPMLGQRLAQRLGVSSLGERLTQ